MSWMAAAVVGSAVVGGIAADKASSRAADANREATDAAGQATADRLAFDKQVYAEGGVDRKFASDTARQMSLWQGEDRARYNALQDEQIARGRKYQGAEDRMLAEAESFNTDAKREQLAGLASADVNQAFANAIGQNTRAQQRMGVNPNSGRSLAMGNQMAIAQAAALAQGSNGARTQAEIQDYARKMDALGLGKGIIGNQATQATLGLSSGNSSVNNSLVPLNVAGSANSAMSQGYGNAALGFTNQANLQANNFYGSQAYGSRAGQAVGSLFGSIANRFIPTPNGVIPMQPGGGY